MILGVQKRFLLKRLFDITKKAENYNYFLKCSWYFFRQNQKPLIKNTILIKTAPLGASGHHSHILLQHQRDQLIQGWPYQTVWLSSHRNTHEGQNLRREHSWLSSQHLMAWPCSLTPSGRPHMFTTDKHHQTQHQLSLIKIITQEYGNAVYLNTVFLSVCVTVGILIKQTKQ